MRRLGLSVAAWLWASSALAMPTLPRVPFDLDLDGVTVADVVVSVFRDVEQMPYMVAPEVYADRRPVSVHLSGVGEEFHQVAVSYLERMGYSVRRDRGVYYIGLKAEPDAKPEEPRSNVIYRPQYRSSAYLTDQVRALVPGVRFGTDRGIAPVPVSLASAGVMARSSLAGSAGAAGGMAPRMSAGTMATDITAVAAQASPTSALGQIDRTSDVIVANGTDLQLGELMRLLPLLDTPEGDLVVRATVFEVTTTDQEGSALQLAASLLGSKLLLNYGPATSLSDSLTIKTSSITAVASALSADSHFRSLSSPVAHVRSGSEAVLNSGSDVPILDSVSYQGASGTPVQSVQYRSSGVLLTVRPVLRERIIAVDVRQELSNFVPTASGVTQTPTLNKRSMSTALSVEDGDIVLLGGLTLDSATKNEEGLSFLPSFLAAKTGNKGRSEIIMVLQITKGAKAVEGPMHLLPNALSGVSEAP